MSYVANAQNTLRQMAPKGATVYGVMRSYYQRGGMTRRYSFLLVTEGRIADVTGLVALSLDQKRDGNGYIPVRGTGFNGAAHVVGNLSWALYQDEYALKSESL